MSQVDKMQVMSPAQESAANAALGSAIRAVRLERGFSQERLAELASLHSTYVSGVERGRRNPTWAIIVQLAAALEVKPSDLVKRAE